MNCRASVFWILDKLRGGPISSNLDEISLINENPLSAKSVSIRSRNLRNILSHATNHTKFYSGFKADELESFPVIDKNLIKENYSKFLSYKHKSKKLKKVTTSGSTGTPFMVEQGLVKQNRHKADNIYYNNLAGLTLGAKLYYLRIWNKIVHRNRLKNYAQNVVPVEASKLDLHSIEKNFLSPLLEDSAEKSILAYASTYEAIVKSIDIKYSKPFDANVMAILSMSETLPERIKSKLEYFFSCEVVSRYSNMENGFIGQQIRGSNTSEYSINLASFEVEILKMNSDQPVNNGELGRIVVTDLFNYALPLIRYDTGDVASITYQNIKGTRIPVFERIEGRKVDFITDVNGNLVSPHVITNSLWKYPEVRQFQFIQHAKDKYEMKLNVEQGKRNLSKLVEVELLKYVGKSANIEFTFVDEIPLLSSGKEKRLLINFKSSINQICGNFTHTKISNCSLY